jgi:anti-sigma factor RsiW
MPERLPENRLVGGLWCTEVLGALPDYLEGTLPADVRAHAEEHLRGCDVCTRFGGRYATVVQAIRDRLAEPVADEVAARLDARLSELFD